jgi:hypothetical protein
MSVPNPAIEFHRLRIVALRERAAPALDEQAAPALDEQVALAVSLMAVGWADGDQRARREAVRVLTAVRRVEPEHVRALELLVAAYAAGHAAGEGDAELDEVLRTLERVAPHSRVVEVAGDQRDGDPAAEQRQLLDGLIQAGMHGDEEALRELRSMHGRFPGNGDIHVALMVVSAARGDQAAAVELADDLLVRHPGRHFAHFSTAQVYWRTGRRAEAERQLSLAAATAATDQDRREVDDLRAYLVGEGR